MELWKEILKSDPHSHLNILCPGTHFWDPSILTGKFSYKFSLCGPDFFSAQKEIALSANAKAKSNKFHNGHGIFLHFQEHGN